MKWETFGIIKIYFRKLSLFIYFFELGSYVARLALDCNWKEVWRKMIQIRLRISVEKIEKPKK